MTIPPAFFEAIEDTSVPFRKRLQHAISMTTGDAEHAAEIKAHPRWDAWVSKNRAALTRFRNRMAEKIEKGDADGVPFSEMVERPLIRAILERMRQTGEIDRTLSKVIDGVTPAHWTLIYTSDEGVSILTSLSVENTIDLLENTVEGMKSGDKLINRGRPR
jgi:hypothetical protein